MHIPSIYSTEYTIYKVYTEHVERGRTIMKRMVSKKCKKDP